MRHGVFLLLAPARVRVQRGARPPERSGISGGHTGVARRAIGNAPQRALRLLNLHQRRFPSGELTAERLFLRADAYQRLGRTADAHREADALVRSFPQSTYARLVADLVDPRAVPTP